MPIIGREEELAALCGLLQASEPAHRLLTVIGPGGVGKTRLALEAAEQAEGAFSGGAAFVPLAVVRESTLVAASLAQALDVRAPPGRPPLEAVIAALRDRRFLLVVDNLEHLIDERALAEIASLLAGCPELTVLGTSRVPLRLQHERRFTLAPLAVPSANESPQALCAGGAVALFVTRAQQMDRDFALNEANAEIVAEICRRLDGLPLAIELAAAWVRILSPHALLERLQPRLPLLRGGSIDLPSRQRTMRDAIAWSHDLLTEEEQRAFRRLAVFVGGFSLTAATTVLQDPESLGRYPTMTLELLASLCDKSLLQRVPSSADEPRFTMLETVREFALEPLAESGEMAASEAKRSAYILDLVERIAPELAGPREGHWHDVLDDELGNLRATLSWALEHDVEMALRLGGALWNYWAWTHLSEGRRWLAAALALPTTAPDRVRAKALQTASSLASLEGDSETTVEQATAAIALASAAGDQACEAGARWSLSIAQSFLGDMAAATAEADRALAAYAAAETAVDRVWAAYARAYRGALAGIEGDGGAALAYYEQAANEIRKLESVGISLIILGDYAAWLLDMGHLVRVREILDEALALAPRYRQAWLVGPTLISLALFNASAGDARSAARQLGAVEGLRLLTGLSIPPHYVSRMERARTAAAASLGGEAYATALEEGRTDPGEVIAVALGEREDVPSTLRAALACGLSRREHEVLILMTDGLSDREIASRLYVSPRTVSSHVSAVLHKLGSISRTAATAQAVRGGLV